jgi:hypothetical protein
MGVPVFHGAPVECALGGVRQGSDDLDPVGYFERGQLAAAVPQDLLGRQVLVMTYDYGADALPERWVGDGEYGRLGDTATSGEGGLDVLG